MYKNLKDDNLNKLILDSSLFYKLDYCYDSCFFLNITIKKTKDEKCMYCNYGNYMEYDNTPKTKEYEVEMEEFINLLNENKDIFLNHLELDNDLNFNIEIIIECEEAYEGSKGLLILVI